MSLNRRSFVGNTVAALGALGLAAAPAGAQLIDTHADWNSAAFDKLLRHTGRGKQVFDIRALSDAKTLNGIKNSLNGLHFGYDIPMSEIKLVAALHGPPNLLNFDDSMWEKYRLGEFAQVIDPKTGKPAIRNIFYNKMPGRSTDVADRNSIYQDTSIEALMERGVQFLSCHTASEEQAHVLVPKLGLKISEDELVHDLQAHTVPGVLVVPSMVATLCLLQSQGHYTYIAG
jgi:intracellular sulfur oxidation DsrE/DsrF family protein